MKAELKKLLLTLGFVLFWLLSAYFTAEVWLPTRWAIHCAAINALLGVLALIFSVSTQRGYRLFYYGPDEDGEGWIVIAILWSIPISIVIMGILWWLMRFVFQWLGWWRL